MMRPAQYDFTIYQGSVFDRTFTYRNPDDSLVNLTGYTARLQLRDRPRGLAVADFTSSPAAGLTLGGVAGTIRLLISALVTAEYDWSVADYDLELTPPSGAADTFKLLTGTASLAFEHTR